MQTLDHPFEIYKYLVAVIEGPSGMDDIDILLCPSKKIMHLQEADYSTLRLWPGDKPRPKEQFS